MSPTGGRSVRGRSAATPAGSSAGQRGGSGGDGPGGRRWRLVRASKDAVPASLRRYFSGARGLKRGLRMVARPRWLQARRRRLVGLAAAVAVLVLAAGWIGWGTSLFGVREVRVTGTESLSETEVREQAAVPEQTPLLRVGTGEVADRVRDLPPVAQVRVRRAWPDTVVIAVVERTAVAAVPTSGDFLLIDAEGVGFRTVAEPEPALPVVIVAEPGPDDPATAAAVDVLSALTAPLREELATLTVQGPAGIRLELASGWTVVWGDAADSEEKARVATALLDRDGEVIDVSAPEVVSVR